MKSLLEKAGSEKYYEVLVGMARCIFRLTQK